MDENYCYMKKYNRLIENEERKSPKRKLIISRVTQHCVKASQSLKTALFYFAYIAAQPFVRAWRMFKTLCSPLLFVREVLSIFYQAGVLRYCMGYFAAKMASLMCFLMLIMPTDTAIHSAMADKLLSSMVRLLPWLAAYKLAEFSLDAICSRCEQQIVKRLHQEVRARHEAFTAAKGIDPALISNLRVLMTNPEDGLGNLLLPVTIVCLVLQLTVGTLGILATYGMMWQGALVFCAGLALQMVTKGLASKLARLRTEEVVETNKRSDVYVELNVTNKWRFPNRYQRFESHYADLTTSITDRRTQIRWRHSLTGLISQFFSFVSEYCVIPLLILGSYFSASSAMTYAVFSLLLMHLTRLTHLSTQLTQYFTQLASIKVDVITISKVLGRTPSAIFMEECKGALQHTPTTPTLELADNVLERKQDGSLVFKATINRHGRAWKKYFCTLASGAVIGCNGSGKSIFYQAIAAQSTPKTDETVLTLSQTQRIPSGEWDIWSLICDEWPHKITQKPDKDPVHSKKPRSFSDRFLRWFRKQPTKQTAAFSHYQTLEQLPTKKSCITANKKEVMDTFYKCFEAIGGASGHFGQKGQPFEVRPSTSVQEIADRFKDNPEAFFKDKGAWIKPHELNGGAKSVLLLCVYLTIALHAGVDVLITDEIDKEWDTDTVEAWCKLRKVLHKGAFERSKIVHLETTHRSARTDALSQSYKHFYYALKSGEATQSMADNPSLWSLYCEHDKVLELYNTQGENIHKETCLLLTEEINKRGQVGGFEDYPSVKSESRDAQERRKQRLDSRAERLAAHYRTNNRILEDRNTVRTSQNQTEIEQAEKRLAKSKRSCDLRLIRVRAVDLYRKMQKEILLTKSCSLREKSGVTARDARTLFMTP